MTLPYKGKVSCGSPAKLSSLDAMEHQPFMPFYSPSMLVHSGVSLPEVFQWVRVQYVPDCNSASSRFRDALPSSALLAAIHIVFAQVSVGGIDDNDGLSQLTAWLNGNRCSQGTGLLTAVEIVLY